MEHTFTKNRHFRTTMQPGAFALFMRQNLIWQFFRLIIIGLKIMSLMKKGHH
jgi:hypothetical protein